MSSFYHLKVGSLPDYEELVAEIYINDKFVGLLSQEDGPERTLFEFAPAESAAPMKLDLSTLEKAITDAKQQLWRLRKVQPSNQ